MRRLHVLTLALAALLLFAGGPASAFAASSRPLSATEASLTVLEGTVTVIDGRDGSVDQGVSGLRLLEGDRIITGNPWRAVLTFSDGSETTLEPSSELLVDTLGQAESGGLFVQLSQSAGMTFNLVASLVTFTRFEVHTPNATAMVRGTNFVVTVNVAPGTTRVIGEEVKVDEGTVEVLAGGATHILNEGDLIAITPSDPPGGVATARVTPATAQLRQAAAAPQYGQGAGVTRARELPRTGDGLVVDEPIANTADPVVAAGLMLLGGALLLAVWRQRTTRGLRN